MVRVVLSCLAVLCFYAIFYRTVVKRWGYVVQPILAYTGLHERYPVRQVEAVGKLAAAGIAQGFFALVMLLILGIGPGSLVGSSLRVDLLLLGGMLGPAELALSSLLCTAAVQLVVAANPARGSESVQEWLAQGRGGWMSQFSATVKTIPAWSSVFVVSLYVSMEELIFRGVLIGLLRGIGMGWAVGISTVLFVVVQSFNMPSVRAAVFPMIGAAVVGVTHGLIFWYVPDILPLIAAHLIYFAGTLRLLYR